jgi:hypothetical protein
MLNDRLRHSARSRLAWSPDQDSPLVFTRCKFPCQDIGRQHPYDEILLLKSLYRWQSKLKLWYIGSYSVDGTLHRGCPDICCYPNDPMWLLNPRINPWITRRLLLNSCFLSQRRHRCWFCNWPSSYRVTTFIIIQIIIIYCLCMWSWSYTVVL